MYPNWYNHTAGFYNIVVVGIYMCVCVYDYDMLIRNQLQYNHRYIGYSLLYKVYSWRVFCTVMIVGRFYTTKGGHRGGVGIRFGPRGHGGVGHG